MRALVAWIVGLGADPADDEELRLRKVLLVTAAMLVLPAGALWGGIYWLAGAPAAAVVPWAYVAISTLALAVFAVTHSYGWLALVIRLAFFTLPFILSWVLGGFMASSGVALWASIAPLAALVLGHRRAAVAILVAYVALLAASAYPPLLAVFDGVRGPPLPPALVTAFFVLNLGTVPTVAFFIVRASVSGQAGLLTTARGIVARYLPPAVAETVADPRRQALGGQVSEISVLFADLGGYTGYSESHSPSDVVELLNTYFAAAIPAILDEGGTPTQLPGDAVMAVFGAPVAQADHADRAVRAARRILREAGRLAADDPAAPRFRIGVNSGPALVGNIGSEEYRSFTAIGDTTNLAQRLQSTAPAGGLVIGGATAALLRDPVALEPLPSMRVKGREQPVEPFAVITGPVQRAR